MARGYSPESVQQQQANDHHRDCERIEAERGHQFLPRLSVKLNTGDGGIGMSAPGCRQQGGEPVRKRAAEREPKSDPQQIFRPAQVWPNQARESLGLIGEENIRQFFERAVLSMTIFVASSSLIHLTWQCCSDHLSD